MAGELLQIHAISNFSATAMKSTAVTLPQFSHALIQPLNFRSTHRRRTPSISCTRKKPRDADLATELAMEVAKLKTQAIQKHKAMKKSREVLFAEICKFAALEEDEMKVNWRNLGDEERRILVKEFLSDWGVGFQPLSARSVKEMVDDYLEEEEKEVKATAEAASGASSFFPVLMKLIGLGNTENSNI